MIRSSLLFFALVLSACYRPEAVEGSFRCVADLGNRCPDGLTCSAQGLCVRSGEGDLGRAPLDLAGDQATASIPRTCEERVQQGAFSNLVALSLANTAGDEEHLSFDATGNGRLLFQRGNALFSAPLVANNPKAITAPVAISLVGAPAGVTLHGGSFTSDGKYWFAGTDAGATSLYTATPADATTFNVTGPRLPTSSSCAFADPVFQLGKATMSSQLYLSYAIAGCGGVSYAARGTVDLNIGAFYSALPDNGWVAPTLTSSGLMLLVSSTAGGRHIYGATRSDVQFQFMSATRIPLTSIGESTEDRQAVVSSDCGTIYFSSVRNGGAGGADLYAADIATE